MFCYEGGKDIMKDNRENNFGIIRLIAASMVIVGHMFILIGLNPPALIWNSVQGFGVASFFCIGGYLCTLGWLRHPDFKQYLIKRIFRIFPALIVYVLLTVFIVGPLMTNLSIADYFSNSMTWKYLSNCRLYINYKLPGVFDSNIVNAVNGSLWFLPVQFLMYLLVPIYIGIGSHMPLKTQKWYYAVTTLIIIVFRCSWTTWFYDTHYSFYGMDLSQAIHVLPYFFIGCFFAVCKLERFLSMQIVTIAVLVVPLCLLLPVSIGYYMECTLIPYLILSLALAEKPIFAKFNKFDISYGMFLFGFTIQQALIKVFTLRNWSLNIWVLIVLSVSISGLMGMITEKFIDRPAGKVCKRILKKMAGE